MLAVDACGKSTEFDNCLRKIDNIDRNWSPNRILPPAAEVIHRQLCSRWIKSGRKLTMPSEKLILPIDTARPIEPFHRLSNQAILRQFSPIFGDYASGALWQVPRFTQVCDTDSDGLLYVQYQTFSGFPAAKRPLVASP